MFKALKEWEFWLLGAVVATIYLARLTALPPCGEETRWANAASEMIASGDWIVPRQQGQVFPERPPMTMWAMAVVGLARGEVDLVAIRLPSAVAIVLTSLLIYAYARNFLPRLGALTAGLAFATFGQVLQIGRLGESEAIFTLFFATGLLLWHWGYMRCSMAAITARGVEATSWPMMLTWIVAYGFVALAALVKGPQAPIYLVAVTSVYLWRRGELRRLVSWSHLAGLATFALVIGAWQIPFYRDAGWQATHDTWSGLAGDRIQLAGLAKHMATYPFETFGCLLPWSVLLLFFANRSLRRGLDAERPWIEFLVTAVVVTYPSLWLATGARGRYFMPLYPCLAILVGVVVTRIATGEVDGSAARWLSRMARPQWSAIAFALFLGALFDGPILQQKINRCHDLAPEVSRMKQQLASPEKLVSFGPIAHRFAYYYGDPIEELPWPTEGMNLPRAGETFCFDLHPGDTAETRFNGRGRTWSSGTSALIPFAWDEIARIACDPFVRDNPDVMVIVGRVRAQNASNERGPRAAAK